jgi:hypothetical protein
VMLIRRFFQSAVEKGEREVANMDEVDFIVASARCNLCCILGFVGEDVVILGGSAEELSRAAEKQGQTNLRRL